MTLLLIVILILPVFEVDSQPRLFHFGGQESVPVGSFLDFLKDKINFSGSDSVFGFLQNEDFRFSPYTLLKDRQGISPSNQNSLYLLHLFYSDNEIITVHGRPAISTMIGWFKSSRLFISLFVSMVQP